MKFNIGISKGDKVRMMDGREGEVIRTSWTTAVVEINDDAGNYQIMCGTRSLRKIGILGTKFREVKAAVQAKLDKIGGLI